MTLSGAKSSPRPAPVRAQAVAQTLLEVALLTDVGQVRPMNEDSGIAVPLPEGGLFVVADGMGGHNAGDVASQMAVRLLQEHYLSNKGEVPTRLIKTLEEVNRQVYAEASRPDRRGMGTTVTALAVDGPNALIVNVGDSRIYLVRGGVLTQLTRDHSWVAEQQRRGLLSEDEARNHRWRSVISNALGSTGDLKLDLSGVKLEPGDLFLLCSDGLTGVLEDSQLAPFLTADLPLERKVRNLVDAANAGGGPDNITALLVKVESVGGQTRPYELPTLQGDGPVLARTLLGIETEAGVQPLSVPNSLPYVVALYVVLLALILAPEPYRTALVPVLFLAAGMVAYLWWRGRRHAHARYPNQESLEEKFTPIPPPSLDNLKDTDEDEDARGGFSSR